LYFFLVPPKFGFCHLTLWTYLASFSCRLTGFKLSWLSLWKPALSFCFFFLRLAMGFYLFSVTFMALPSFLIGFGHKGIWSFPFLSCLDPAWPFFRPRFTFDFFPQRLFPPWATFFLFFFFLQRFCSWPTSALDQTTRYLPPLFFSPPFILRAAPHQFFSCSPSPTHFFCQAPYFFFPFFLQPPCFSPLRLGTSVTVVRPQRSVAPLFRPHFCLANVPHVKRFTFFFPVPPHPPTYSAPPYLCAPGHPPISNLFKFTIFHSLPISILTSLPPTFLVAAFPLIRLTVVVSFPLGTIFCCTHFGRRCSCKHRFASPGTTPSLHVFWKPCGSFLSFPPWSSNPLCR